MQANEMCGGEEKRGTRIAVKEALVFGGPAA